VGADTDALIAHFAQPSYNVLWERINDCLSKVQNNPKMLFVATVMLPLIECLMIVCKYMMAHNQRERERAGLPPVASSDQLTEDLFYAFTERHRKILNTLVRQNPKLLRGSFSLLVHNPKVLEFDNKRNYFNQQLHKKPPNQRSRFDLIISPHLSNFNLRTS
jgi:E3 ubiquitin-protein ligase HUWE1